MAHEYFTFAEIAARNRMSNEFAKSLKNNTSVNPTAAPVMTYPKIEVTAPIAAPPAQAIELPSQVTQVVTTTDQEFPLGKVILVTVVLAGVVYGVVKLIERNRKNKDQKSKEANNIYDWKYSGVDQYTPENSNNKHYTMEEIVDMPEHLFHPKVKEEPVLSPITTFMPLPEDAQNNTSAKTRKRSLRHKVSRPAISDVFNSGDHFNENYSSDILKG